MRELHAKGCQLQGLLHPLKGSRKPPNRESPKMMVQKKRANIPPPTQPLPNFCIFGVILGIFCNSSPFLGRVGGGNFIFFQKFGGIFGLDLSRKIEEISRKVKELMFSLVVFGPLDFLDMVSPLTNNVHLHTDLRSVHLAEKIHALQASAVFLRNACLNAYPSEITRWNNLQKYPRELSSELFCARDSGQGS